MLQPVVLLLDLPQPPRLPDSQAAVLGLPVVVALLADLVRAAQVPDVRPGLALLQNPDDLLLAETTLPHPGSPFAAKISRLGHISTDPVFAE